MLNYDNADAGDGSEFDKAGFPNSITPCFVDQELSL